MKPGIRFFLTGFILSTVAVFSSAGDTSLINDPDSGYSVSFSVEYGALKVLENTLRFGASGVATDFDFVTMGGEEILFPYERYTAELTIADRHNIVLLYQPLTVTTRARFQDDVVVDDVTFASGSNVELTYGFPFWRVSYLYDFIDNRTLELGAGLSLQLRNASIVFAALDGTALTVNQNLGPVPIIKLRAAYRFPRGAFISTDIDGFYASSAFFNGSDFEFEGSVLDASLRGGLELKYGIDAFVNLRFIGGTAKGVSQYDSRYWTEGVSNETSNVLATLALTVGMTTR